MLTIRPGRLGSRAPQRRETGYLTRPRGTKCARGASNLGSYLALAASDRSIVVLFTDIVGSVELTRELGDERMDAVKRLHFDALNRLLDQFGGFEVKRTGDGLLAIFLNSKDALRFAWRAYTEPGDERLHIRIGLNRGEAGIGEDDVSGHEVNLAARVMNALPDSGVMLSDRVKSDLNRRLGQTFALPRMENVHSELKGIGVESLWRVTAVREAFFAL